MPAAVTEPPEVVIETEASIVGTEEVAETDESIITESPDGTITETAVGAPVFNDDVAVGASWPVDGLVGQINGRPIFAAEFFLPFQDQLSSQIKLHGPLKGRAEIDRLVIENFQRYRDSELVIAEAESELTPAMQQGIFAWLGNVEDELTAERGGTRFAAEQSILDETGMTLEEFLQERKLYVLSDQLLRKRIEPRAIVSWRDIEQVYRSRLDIYRPAGSVQIGRIMLLKSRDGEKIELARAAFAEGNSFADVAGSNDIGGGFWRAFTVGEEGVATADGLSEKIKVSLSGKAINEASAPQESSKAVAWYAILGYDAPPSRSIFDPEVQLEIRNEIKGMRTILAREHYLKSLRRQWVTDDMDKMLLRLLKIAHERYLP